YRQNTIRPTPGYSNDPWSVHRYAILPPNQPFGRNTGRDSEHRVDCCGTGLPDLWWKRQENVKVTLLGKQGFILNR
ncbi:hypothetical protein DFP72DRAFT_778093, partial [Ephemerocybe angulata]